MPRKYTTLDKYKSAIRRSIIRQEAHIAEAANQSVDRLIHKTNVSQLMGEYNWFHRYISVMIPPTPAGYFPYDLQTIKRLGEEHHVTPMIIDQVIEECSQMAVRTSILIRNGEVVIIRR